MATTVVVPITTSVSAGTEITLPGDARLSKLAAAYKQTMSDASVAGANSALTVTTETPGAGEIQLKDERTVVCGDALDSKNVLILVGLAPGEVQGY